VKDVPAGATAAGIPARILDEAKKVPGFNAYGIGNDQNDPFSKSDTRPARPQYGGGSAH